LNFEVFDPLKLQILGGVAKNGIYVYIWLSLVGGINDICHTNQSYEYLKKNVEKIWTIPFTKKQQENAKTILIFNSSLSNLIFYPKKITTFGLYFFCLELNI